ncbi:MAG: sulfotransferase family 2 domain-containing protein [Actinomycetota bacterium]
MHGEGERAVPVWQEFFHHPAGGFVLAVIPNVASGSAKRWFLSMTGPHPDNPAEAWRPFRLSYRPSPDALVRQLPTFVTVRDPRSRLASVYITHMIRPPVEKLSPSIRTLIEVMSGDKLTPDHPRLSYREFATGLSVWRNDDALDLHLRPQASFVRAAGPQPFVCRSELQRVMLAGLTERAGRPVERTAAEYAALGRRPWAVPNGTADRTAGEWRRRLGAGTDTMIARPTSVGRGPVLDLRTSEVRDPGADELIAERYRDDLDMYEGAEWDPSRHDWRPKR